VEGEGELVVAGDVDVAVDGDQAEAEPVSLVGRLPGLVVAVLGRVVAGQIALGLAQREMAAVELLESLVDAASGLGVHEDTISTARTGYAAAGRLLRALPQVSDRPAVQPRARVSMDGRP